MCLHLAGVLVRLEPLRDCSASLPFTLSFHSFAFSFLSDCKNMYSCTISSLVLSLAARAGAQTYSATYMPSDAPDHTQQGQYGTNACGVSSSQSSMCQNAYRKLSKPMTPYSPSDQFMTLISPVNSVDDFCLFAPPYPGSNSTIGDTERIEVSWCLKDGYGTRVIPDGSITGAHFVQTPDYIQVMGVGDLTQLNIPAGDTGGELDPHGQDGNGNPIGGLVFSNAFGQLEQLHEWTVSVDSTHIGAC